MNFKIKPLKNNAMPYIHIHEDAYRTMMGLVKECDIEIGWLAHCKKKENHYYIYDVEICKQKCHGATTELDEVALQDLYEKYKNDPDRLNDVRVWGHSHVNMQPEPSDQDDETFEYFADSCEFFIRLIFNKKAKYTCTLLDNESGYIYEGLTFDIINSKERHEILNQIDELQKQLDEYDKRTDDYYIKYCKGLVKDNVEKFHIYNNFKTSYTGKNATLINKNKKKNKQSSLRDDWDAAIDNSIVTTGTQIRDGNKYVWIDDILDNEDIQNIGWNCKDPKEVCLYLSGNGYSTFDDYDLTEIENLKETCEEILEINCYM